MPGCKRDKYNSWSPKLGEYEDLPPAEITVLERASTHYFAEMRSFFPFWEGWMASNPRRSFIIRYLTFGTPFSVLWRTTNRTLYETYARSSLQELLCRYSFLFRPYPGIRPDRSFPLGRLTSPPHGVFRIGRQQ